MGIKGSSTVSVTVKASKLEYRIDIDSKKIHDIFLKIPASLTFDCNAEFELAEEKKSG